MPHSWANLYESLGGKTYSPFVHANSHPSCIPKKHKNHTPVSFSKSLIQFSYLLRSHLILPRKPHAIRSKHFHAPVVHVCLNV